MLSSRGPTTAPSLLPDELGYVWKMQSLPWQRSSEPGGDKCAVLRSLGLSAAPWQSSERGTLLCSQTEAMEKCSGPSQAEH